MDGLSDLINRISARHSVKTSLRPGVVFAYFGQGAGLEIRRGDGDDRFDCTIVSPHVPLRTVQASGSEVLQMAEDLACGRLEACAQRGHWPGSNRGLA